MRAEEMQARREIEQQLITRAQADHEFRRLLVADPHEAIRQACGYQLPRAIQLSVHEDSEANLHFVLPLGDRLSDSDLTGISAGFLQYHADG